MLLLHVVQEGKVLGVGVGGRDHAVVVQTGTGGVGWGGGAIVLALSTPCCGSGVGGFDSSGRPCVDMIVGEG